MADEIQWLHVSDFHTGKDNFAQRQIFKKILTHLDNRLEDGFDPDFVVISGDVANAGKEKEYEIFIENFLFPLIEKLGSEKEDRIFIVPGNHDADLTKCRAVRKHGVLEEVPEFLDPDDKGLVERKCLFERFKFFSSLETGDRADWLFSAEGCFTTILDVRGTDIGILGLNTAWLSQKKDDRHMLSPGKGILDLGLDIIKECGLRIVLGHHPLDWMLDGEVEALRSILAQKGALYLHGHLHKNRQRLENGSGLHFATIQCGAGFQAREDEEWINGILYGSTSIAEKKIYLEPYFWSSEHNEWKIDSRTFPEKLKVPDRECWALDIPAPHIAADEKNIPKDDTGPMIEGWEIIDKDYLDNTKPPATEDILTFYNGGAPNWELINSDAVPKRSVVKEIADKLKEQRKMLQTGLVLIKGPGGEGKSTILHQVVAEVVTENENWRALWPRNGSSFLSPVDILRLSGMGGTWVIALDEADIHVDDVLKVVKHIHKSHRTNFLFLLCCRETDWIAAGGRTHLWRKLANFREILVTGIKMEDAVSVVKAWARLGKKGLRAISDVEQEEGARRLVGEGRKSAPEDDGTFLGALLRVRFGEEGLKDHVRTILERFKNYNTSVGDLLEPFAYIVALHAQGAHILSKEVLANVLGLTMSTLADQVLGHMKGEAVTIAGNRVLVRHRAIADVAAEILEKEHSKDLDEMCVSLVRSARELYASGKRIHKPGEWGYLSKDIFDRGKEALGIRLAQVVHEIEPENAFFAVQLSHLYRKSDQPDEAINVFRSGGEVMRDRAYYYEWGTAEGFVNNYGIGAWLDAYAMSDACAPGYPDRKRIVYCLNGLVVAFQKLHDSFALDLFLKASYASAFLSSRIDGECRFTRESDRKARESCLTRNEDLGFLKPLEALDIISKAATEAWNRRETNLVAFEQIENTLTFKGVEPIFPDRNR